MWIMFASTKSELLDRSKGKKNLKCKFAKFHTNIWAWTLSARNVTANQDQTASNRGHNLRSLD